MTKPKDFIFSSDYLSLAQYDKTKLKFDIPAKSTTASSTYTVSMGKDVQPEVGSIDRFYLSFDGNTWNVASSIKKIFEKDSDLLMTIFSYRSDENSIKIRVEYTNKTANSYTFPATTVYVDVCSFKPPNIL